MSDTIRWVRIVEVPAGEAPLWAREAWVGVELPDLGEIEPLRLMGILSGKPVKIEENFFLVSVRMAVDILAQKNPLAAEWFRQHTNPYFNFGFRQSEIIGIPTPSAPPPSAEIKEFIP